MVTVIKCHLRKSKNGKEFVTLELQGDLELVQSLRTGKFYATAKTCSITSTFTEEVAQKLIGKTLPGSIIRTQTDAYEFMVPESGEVITLAHTYQYVPEENTSLRLHTVPTNGMMVQV